MINIISRSIVSPHTRGPRKVVTNTLKGLDAIGVPYVVNHALEATDFIWIHDDPVALEAVASLPPQAQIVAGPNVYTLPTEIPPTIATNARITWLHPAPWVQSFWQAFGGETLRSMVWPAGIDTEQFRPSDNQKDITLVYQKSRAASDVAHVCAALTLRQEPHLILTYGEYREEEYQALLRRSKALIWVGRSESQGIALLEAMAMNIPVLVWDITRFGEWEGGGKERFSPAQLNWTNVTAAPYFDEACGEKITNASELPAALDTLYKRLSTYTPREYVLKELSLEKQAHALLAVFLSTQDASRERLMDTSIRTTRVWRNATWYFRLFTALKGALRSFVR